MQKGWYSIKQISQITGLSTFVIRKWEERYNCIKPKRLENGYRVYSDDDIRLLLAMKKLVDQGYSVKNALLSITNEDFSDKSAKQSAPLSQLMTSLPIERLESNTELSILNELIMGGQQCDEKKMLHVLMNAFHEYGTSYLIHEVLQPFLHAIGEKWLAGEWSEHHEHIASMTIRDFLVQIRSTFPEPDHAPVLLAACLPHEKHEIPLHMILLEAKLKGWKTMFLGASPAPGAIERAVNQILPKKVVISATTTTPFEEDPEVLSKLDELARKYPDISFYLGGAGAWQFEKIAQLKSVIVSKDIKEMLRITQSN